MGVILVQIAQIGLAKNGERLKTTLGSCVGVILHDAGHQVGGLAHVMLPQKVRGDDSIGKYADTAIPELAAQVQKHGAQRRGLQAYLAGGASMFKCSEDGIIASIGERNIEAARRALAGLGIPVIHEEVGGERGRTVVFDSGTGELEVNTLQKIAWKGEP